MSMANEIVNGDWCEICGCALEGGGYPQKCKSCGGDAEELTGEENDRLEKIS